MSAGLPYSASCVARNDTNVFDQNNIGAASMVSEIGKRGLTFIRGSAEGIEMFGPEILEPQNKEIYERNWARQKAFLDAAHAAGVYVLVNIGADPLARSVSRSVSQSVSCRVPTAGCCSICLAARTTVIIGYRSYDSNHQPSQFRQSLSLITEVATVISSYWS